MNDPIPHLVQQLQWYAEKKRWPKGLAPLGGLLKQAIAALSAAEPELSYHCDVCTMPGYGDSPCSPLCDRPAPSVAVIQLPWVKNEGSAFWRAEVIGLVYEVHDDAQTEIKKRQCQNDFEARIRSALSAQAQDVAIPEGWQLAPIEPTPEMIEAFADACWKKLQDTYGSNPTEEPEDGGGSIGYGYRAMLAAAPAKQEQYNKPLDLNITKEWFEKRATLEGDHEIGAGRPALTPAATAELGRFAPRIPDGLRIVSNTDEGVNARFRLAPVEQDDATPPDAFQLHVEAVREWALFAECSGETDAAKKLSAVADFLSSLDPAGGTAKKENGE